MGRVWRWNDQEGLWQEGRERRSCWGGRTSPGMEYLCGMWMPCADASCNPAWGSCDCKAFTPMMDVISQWARVCLIIAAAATSAPCWQSEPGLKLYAPSC